MKHLLLLMMAMLVGTCSGADGVARPRSTTAVRWDAQSFRDVTYKEVGGRKLLMDIYLPPGRKPEKAPVVYFVHGGGWVAGNKEKIGNRNTLPVFRRLSEKGVVCVSVGYRLCRKGHGVVMRDCVTDAMDGLRFLKKNAGRYGIDPDRIVVFGESAGGQIAQMLTFASPDGFPGDGELVAYGVQPRAGISWYGPSDFTDVDLFRTALSDKDPDRFGGRITGGEGGYAENPEAYKELSPAFWIKKDSPPLLMIQGDRDTTIPVKHAYRMQRRAEELQAPVEIMIVRNAGHNWRKADGVTAIEPTTEQIIQRTVDFAAEHGLKRPTP